MMVRRTEKVVGVLGGMGPYATVAFFKCILHNTPAQKDWEHVRLVIDNHTKIPSRTRHLLYGEASPVEEMRAACLQLQGYPIDAIALPCNSAAHFLQFFERDIDIPIFNICAATSAKLKSMRPNAGRVLVLGSHVTYRMQTYRQFLEVQNMSLEMHTEGEQEKVVELIERIKLDGCCKDPVAVESLIRHLVKCHNADAVILGCTELTHVLGIKVDATLVDSTEALAQQVIDFASPQS